MKYDEKEEIF